MNAPIKWILDNFFNLISLAGFFATLYLGLYYVPSWFQDAQKQKVTNAERRIEMTLKELVYADSTLKYSEVLALIKANEAEIEQAYPVSADQILANVQSSFLEDKFLPLSVRKACFAKLEVVRSAIPPLELEKKSESKASIFLVYLFSALITLLATGLGVTSFYLRWKKARDSEEEISNQGIETSKTDITNLTGVKYEQLMISEIENFPGVTVQNRHLYNDNGVDLSFSYHGRQYHVEFKYLSVSKVGVGTIERFLQSIKGYEGDFWFVHNTDITSMVQSRIKEFSKMLGKGQEIRMIHAASVEEMREKLQYLLKP